MITLKLTLRPPSTILKDVFRHDEMKCFVCNANGGQFSFPKEEDKLQKWITSLDIDRPKIVGANGPRICLKHFDQNDFTQKNRTRLASSAVPKPVISHVHCKSFSNVRMGTETKIIGKDGSSTMVDLSVLAAMSNFSPLLKSILKDSPSSLESIHIPDVRITIIPIVTRAPPQSPALFPPTQKWLASRRSRTRRRTSRSRSRIPSRGESLNLLYSTVYIVV